MKQVSMKKMESKCDMVAALLRAIAHPQRLMILGHLIEGEKTVTQLVDLCEISQSQLSQFLSRMRLEGLLSCERKGRYQFYAVTDKQVVRLVQAIQTIYC